MVKGHNKGDSNDPNPENKAQGQDRHLKESKKDKGQDRGRNPDPDPSEGTKKKNNLP